MPNYTLPPIKFNGITWQYLASGSNNHAYRVTINGNVWVLKIQRTLRFSGTANNIANQAERAVRIWNQMNPNHPARVIADHGQEGWIAPFIPGGETDRLIEDQQARKKTTKAEKQALEAHYKATTDAIIDYFCQYQRVIVDPLKGDNLKQTTDIKTGRRNLMAIDVAAALRFEQNIADDQSEVSLDFWKTMRGPYADYFNLYHNKGGERAKQVRTIKALIVLQYFRPDVRADAATLKSDSKLVDELAKVYDGDKSGVDAINQSFDKLPIDLNYFARTTLFGDLFSDPRIQDSTKQELCKRHLAIKLEQQTQRFHYRNPSGRTVSENVTTSHLCRNDHFTLLHKWCLQLLLDIAEQDVDSALQQITGKSQEDLRRLQDELAGAARTKAREQLAAGFTHARREDWIPDLDKLIAHRNLLPWLDLDHIDRLKQYVEQQLATAEPAQAEKMVSILICLLEKGSETDLLCRTGPHSREKLLRKIETLLAAPTTNAAYREKTKQAIAELITNQSPDQYLPYCGPATCHQILKDLERGLEAVHRTKLKDDYPLPGQQVHMKRSPQVIRQMIKTNNDAQWLKSCGPRCRGVVLNELERSLTLTPPNPDAITSAKARALLQKILADYYDPRSCPHYLPRFGPKCSELLVELIQSNQVEAGRGAIAHAEAELPFNTPEDQLNLIIDRTYLPQRRYVHSYLACSSAAVDYPMGVIKATLLQMQREYPNTGPHAGKISGLLSELSKAGITAEAMKQKIDEARSGTGFGRVNAGFKYIVSAIDNNHRMNGYELIDEMRDHDPKNSNLLYRMIF